MGSDPGRLLATAVGGARGGRGASHDGGGGERGEDGHVRTELLRKGREVLDNRVGEPAAFDPPRNRVGELEGLRPHAVRVARIPEYVEMQPVAGQPVAREVVDAARID